MKSIYSPNLEERYRATLEAPTLSRRKWPVGCGGAANAFLILIGPSRGGARPGEACGTGGANRPRGKPMRIGKDVFNLDWGDRRKARWTRLCADMLGGEKYVGSMTALLNLDGRHATSERDIPKADLQRGLTDHVWPLVEALKPRLVCALTNRVWNTVLPEVESRRLTRFPRCPVDLPKSPIGFALPGVEFPTLVVKTHTHPSRALSYAQIEVLGEACRWFLRASATGR